MKGGGVGTKYKRDETKIGLSLNTYLININITQHWYF